MFFCSFPGSRWSQTVKLAFSKAIGCRHGPDTACSPLIVSNDRVEAMTDCQWQWMTACTIAQLSISSAVRMYRRTACCNLSPMCTCSLLQNPELFFCLLSSLGVEIHLPCLTRSAGWVRLRMGCRGGYLGLRMIQGNWDHLCAGETHDLCCFSSAVQLTKTRKMRWTGHVARKGGGVMRRGFWWGNPRKYTTWKTWA